MAAEAQRARPAQLMTGTVLLISFSEASLADADRNTRGSIQLLEVSAPVIIPVGDRKMHVSTAKVAVNSSGAGNVRSDIEADLRKSMGIPLGADDEVIVALVPGMRPLPVTDAQAAEIEVRTGEITRAVLFGKETTGEGE